MAVLMYLSLSVQIVSFCSLPQRISAYVHGMKPGSLSELLFITTVATLDMHWAFAP